MDCPKCVTIKRVDCICNCARCKGTEVDSRTQEKHTYDDKIKLNISKNPDQDSSHPAPTIDENNNEINYFENDDVDEGEENDDVNNMDEEENNDVNEGEENDDVDNINEEENDDVDEGEENDDVEDFFTSPKIDNDNKEAFIVESLSDSINTEIIIWLFKFQQRFQLPDIALESLIKFFHIILMRFDKLQFKNFLPHYIWQKYEGKVAIMNCSYKEYPNNPISNPKHSNENNIYSDIYDGKHSTGAIYVSICNLPRSERNKPKNIIYLGFLPGPKKAGLERINHYLAPIVDELLELWKGWKVPKTHQFSNGLEIKVALIVGSSDTPATRKLFGHGSAVMKCYRCDKRTTYSEKFRKTHYRGMQDYNEWSSREAHFKWILCIVFSSVLQNG
ncbi:hypothetical protein GLOIN_2v1849215 [Rhizophagus irregularis DAOM 181602=DAOM 197198]|nr:hypothetical protein GLOIN_2v1849215 [Rhizophagus irregularis DAOM 181602=DAOM 197198]